MPETLLDHERGVAAAGDGRNASAAKVIGQPVAARRLAGHHRDAHQVRARVQIKRLVVLLDDLDLVEVGLGQRSDDRQAQVVELFSPLPDRVHLGGRDQQ